MTTRRVVLVLCALLAVAGLAAPVSASPGRDRPAPHGPAATLVQLNLCLSGLAGCYERTRYPEVLDEAVTRVRELRPDAVTLNEACSADAEQLARRTGLRSSFTVVQYRGAPLECTTPSGRGVFGNAVLTRDRVVQRSEAPFVAQDGVEERRWLCVTTTRRSTTCVSHLSTRGTAAAIAANDAQCAELGRVLEQQARRTATRFGGDVNRQDPCAPRGFSSFEDDDATQARGIQHVYGDRRHRDPRPFLVAMERTDHDLLGVRTRVR